MNTHNSATFAAVWLLALVSCGSEPDLVGPQVVAQWHTVELDFEGPDTSETAVDNPFLNYRLDVTFEGTDISYHVRGFYAADGVAADTGASDGNVWRVRFTPDQPGEWRYRARLSAGPDIALADSPETGREIPLKHSAGILQVVASDATAPDFRATGPIAIADGEYRHLHSGALWRKGGANSPENLLGYAEFDATRRLQADAREGEANATATPLHRFAPHIEDWQAGDPVWGRDARGKGLIGAINYLASTGMNAVYFLTLNVGGDGNDVWPFVDPDDPSRFDVSKLAQWNRVFEHMQAMGIAMHVVIQETENELWLDGGDTGPQRRLYFNELIARFSHHPGLIWNLGEENGPAHWLPEGQTTEQRMAMASYLKAHDPYNHPVVLHTHASAQDKVEILTPLLGFEDIDGLSFQVDEPARVHQEVRQWRDLAREAGHPWAITMDEIGHWSRGAVPDADDPDHDNIRRHALWGALMAGASGTEWYFGAHYDANDLTSENWRLRDRLWHQTNIAIEFFDAHLARTTLSACPAGLSTGALYCSRTDDGRILLYLESGEADQAGVSVLTGETYSVLWLAPKSGASESGTISALTPPTTDQDWVALLQPIPQ